MSAIRREGPDGFEIELRALATGGLLDRARRLLDPEDPEITPERVGLALRAVMGRCRQRQVDGGRLVWNDYTVFLALADHETLRPLAASMSEGLLRTLEQERARLGASLVGPLVVRLRCDRDAPLEPGRAFVRARFEPVTATTPAPGELTLRAPELQAGMDKTRRVAEALSAVRLCWLDQRRLLPLGETRLGRPHEGAPPGFLPLLGADAHVNRVQLHLIIEGERVAVHRPPDANPVVVDGAPLAPGAKLALERLPASLALSGGALTLRLERA